MTNALDPPGRPRSSAAVLRGVSMLALAAATCGLGWVWGVSISRRATPQGSLAAPQALPTAVAMPAVAPRPPTGPWDEWTRSYPAQLGELRVQRAADRPEQARIEVVPHGDAADGGGNSLNSLNLARSLVPLLIGQTVELTFRARAESATPLAVWINGTNGHYRNLADVARLELSTDWQSYRLVWTLREGDDYPRLSLGFDCRAAAIDVDALQLRAMARDASADGAIEATFGKCAVEITPIEDAPPTSETR